jgi:CRP-like cAMP-binding protein
MPEKSKPPFDPKAFLSKVDDGRRIQKCRKGQVIFKQGDPAETVFYIQKGKVKLAVVSPHGKEAVVAILGVGDFLGEASVSAVKHFWVRSAARTGPER